MFAIDGFKLKVEKDDKDFAKVSIGPFPKGYGVTIGNALRRILLSSIEGAAVTGAQVSGIKHEYATIPGVADDVLRILLNLKKMPVRCHADEQQVLELKVSSKKVITAKDIKAPSEVEIVDPDFYITEITDTKGKIEMKIFVEKGVGYVPSDEAKRGEVGIIPLDADFSPVKRVVFDLNKTRVGQQTDLDQIDLEIYTNGTVGAIDALERAGEIYEKITNHLLLVLKGDVEVEEEVKEEEEKEEEPQSSDLDIDKLNLSTRLTNSLLKAGYKNLTELEGMTVDEIMEIRGLGQRTAEELIDIMRGYKLDIKE